MNLICFLSNSLAEEPVVSPSSGHVFEKRLIYKFLEENGDKDPVNDKFLKKDMLVEINKNFYNSNQLSLDLSQLSLTELLKVLQEEWDALILQIFYLKKKLYLSNEEKDKLIFKQNDYLKLIESLKNEINFLKKKNCNDNEIIYENLSSNQFQSVNKENLFDKSSFKTNSKNNLSQNEFVEPFSRYPKLNDVSPLNNCNKLLSVSTEYVNLKPTFLDQHQRTKSVIFENDQYFCNENNLNKNYNENRRTSNLFRPKSELLINTNYLDYCNITSELLFLDKKNHYDSLNSNLTSLSNLSETKLSLKLNQEKLIHKNNLNKNGLNKLNVNYLKNYENILLEDELDNLILKKNRDITNLNQSMSSDISKYSSSSNFSNPKNTLTNLNYYINSNQNETKTKSGRITQWSEDFEKLLHDSIGINIFTQFLSKEHSKENIDFWLICEKYKNLSNEEDLKKHANLIYNKYLNDKAKSPININSEARLQVEKDLKKNHITKDLFIGSQKQIFELMKFDSYKRFLESDLYKKCVENEKLNKSLPIELINGSCKTELPLNNKKTRRKSLLIWNKKQK